MSTFKMISTKAETTMVPPMNALNYAGK